MIKSFSLRNFGALVAGIISGIFIMGPVYAQDILNPDETLNPGESLSSANGCYLLELQTDGNLVLYKTRPKMKALWSSKTDGKPASFAIMQSDGNLVVYADGPTRALWNSGTDGRDGSRLVLQDDGNLVIYTPANRPVWNTKTGPQRCK